MNKLGKNVINNANYFAKEVFKEKFVATYVLGSLSYGGFSEKTSDIDFALIINSPLIAQDQDKIAYIFSQIKKEQVPLADRLSIFWGAINPLKNQVIEGRFPPIDVLTLIEYGKLIEGNDIRSLLAPPTSQNIIDFLHNLGYRIK